MKKKTPLFLLITLLSISLFAQQKKGQALIDSLETALKNYDARQTTANRNVLDKSDTLKVKLLIQLCNELIDRNSCEKAKLYANDAFSISDKIGYNKGKADSYGYAGLIYRAQSNYPEALKNLIAASKINEEIGDKRRIAGSYNNIGLIYSTQGNYSEALKYYFKALKLNEETKNKAWLINNNNNIGMVYHSQGNYPEALKHYFNALNLTEETKNKAPKAGLYNNIGAVYAKQNNYSEALRYYFSSLKIKEENGDKKGVASSNNNIGSIYKSQKNYSLALKCHSVALKLYEEIGDKKGIATTYGSIGVNYREQGNYSEALKILSLALNLNKSIGSKQGVAMSYNYLGFTNLKLNNLADAKRQLDSALLISKEVGAKEDIKNAYLYLSNLDSLNGNWQDAYFHHQFFIKYRDSIENDENTKKMAQTVLQYEFDKKQDSIKLVNQKRELALQKELELKALQYEYDKKQAAAKSEKERQQLRYEQQLKQQQIEAAYAQKEAILEAEQQQKEAIAKINQEKKDALTNEEIKRQETLRNFSLMGLATVLLFLGIVVRQRNRVKKEKQRSEDLLLNILPVGVAEELKTTGSAAAKQYNAVSVLFTDFVGFTQLSEELSPTELVAEIHKCFSVFDTIIEKNGLEKIKTIGDAYLAVCGLPNEHKNHAQKTIQAALEIRDYIKHSNSKFEVRIGISSGSVVAGIVGFKKFAYDIWGDTVNTAARMEQNSEAGKINISSSTYELVNKDYSCLHRGKIGAKNKGEIDMYFVE